MEKKELIGLFKYYKGEKENPYKNAHDKGWFWEGERMFLESEQSFDDWADEITTTEKEVKGKAKQFFSKLSEKQKAIVLYINNLIIKWCPMEDADFIFNY